MNCGIRNSDCGRGGRSSCALTFRNPQSAIRNQGLTLIELLIVIVILTTLVAGVIPVLSPNNDVRKIRAAARGLQGYINVAQAQAARTGRPHGIAFRESSPGSGVALEVFTLEVPPPFAGFSTASAARVEYEVGSENKLYVHFVLSDTLVPAMAPPGDYTTDLIPPRFLRPNDVIRIAGRDYRLIDKSSLDADNYYTAVSKLEVQPVENKTTALTTYPVLAYSKGYPGANSVAWTNRFTAPQRYQIHRRAANSSAEPYQLPAGIVIDMQGSVAEGTKSMTWAWTKRRFPVAEASLFDVNSPVPNTVGVLFSPTGAVSRFLLNSSESQSAAKIVLLLGRIENGGIDASLLSSNPSGEAPWRKKAGEKVADVQERINWLNLDSRLLSIMARSGRVVVSETAFVDLNQPLMATGDDLEVAQKQIEDAHRFAHEMNTAK